MSILNLVKHKKARVEGCVEEVCRAQIRHGRCVVCGEVTDVRLMRVDTVTLRRGLAYQCTDCSIHPPKWEVRAQADARRRRTERDWTQVSDRIATELIIGDEMGEQYNGPARQAIRAFVDSGFQSATVPDLDASTLNYSIGSLGLHESVYAESRDKETVLRRHPGK